MYLSTNLAKSAISMRVWIALVALGITLGLSPSISANAEPMSENAAMQKTSPPPVLHAGDLVRVRSGGPLMTVIGIQGDRVICDWAEDHELKSDSFPVAALTPSTMTPPSEPLMTPPSEPNEREEERAADQYYQKHCPSGSVSFTGKFHCAY
jgi:uncharacterized protein YodC (DUF2158 family)